MPPRKGTKKTTTKTTKQRKNSEDEMEVDKENAQNQKLPQDAFTTTVNEDDELTVEEYIMKMYEREKCLLTVHFEEKINLFKKESEQTRIELEKELLRLH